MKEGRAHANWTTADASKCIGNKGKTPGPAPAPVYIGWCEKSAAKNNCEKCTEEEDCGGVKGKTTTCWK